MHKRVSLVLVVALCVLAAGLSPLSSRWMPREITSLVQNASQSGALTGDYDRSFGKNWKSIRIFRLMTPMERPLRIYINTQPVPSTLYKPHYAEYVRDGMNAWAKALDNRFKYVFINDPASADITMDWVQSFPDRYTAGLATYRVGSAGIQIKTIGVPDKDIKANIIHELGHAMGIVGHSTDPNDIMVGMRRWKADDPSYEPRLSANDVKAIRHLYGSNWQRGEDLYTAINRPPASAPASARSIAAQPPEKPASTGHAQKQAVGLAQGVNNASTASSTVPSMDPYLNQLRQQVNQAWQPPVKLRTGPVVVRFEVDKQGRLVAYQLRRSSGSELIDSAALRAVRQAAAKMPVPAQHPQNRVSLEVSLK